MAKEQTVEQLQAALAKARRDARYARKKAREARSELKRKPPQSVRELSKPTIIREPLASNDNSQQRETPKKHRTLTSAVFDAVVNYMRDEVEEELNGKAA